MNDKQNVSMRSSKQMIKKKEGEVTEDELLTELRYKYLTILKSLYFEFFEEGQCSSESLLVLMESADRAMDHEYLPMKDWEFLQSYFLGGRTLQFIGRLARIPLIGELFNSYLFNHFSFTYDVCINFIEAHEEASKMLIDVIIESQFSRRIKNEATPNLLAAENYMHHQIEESFPEITKAIQHRKAQCYLLIHEYHLIEDLLKKGQIETKEAQTLKDEIDEKIFELSTSAPTIKLEDQKTRFSFASDLSEIFGPEELKTAFDQMTKEKLLN